MRALLLIPSLVAAPAQKPLPSWVSVLPERPGRVYGLGVASAANTRALALRQASEGARADVLSRLRATIQSDTRVTQTLQQDKTLTSKGLKTTAQGSTTASTDVRIQAQAADLPGLTVEETYLDDGPNPTLYALAYLDVAVADREIRARYDAIASTLAADPGGSGWRPKLRRARVLKEARADLAKLDAVAVLVRVAGGDPGTRGAIQKTVLDSEKEALALGAELTFGMPAAQEIPVDPDMRDAVKTAILREGIGWSDQAPVFAITLRARKGSAPVKKAWWDYQRSAEFILAQGTLTLSLADREGQEYGSTLITAKGVGINEIQAETLLLQDCRAKAAKAVAQWLVELGGGA